MDFAVQAFKSGIGPFPSQILNLTHSIDNKKSKNLQWEKCRCITDIEQAFSDTAQYFHSKHLKKIPERHEKKPFFFNGMVFWDKKIFSRIECKLVLYANFTKLRGSLN